MTEERIIRWLKTEDESSLAELWRMADEVRRGNVGEEVHLRGLLEISNICERVCTYCGIRAGSSSLIRYRMSDEEILECAEKAASFGYGTLVMQAGESRSLDAETVASLIRRIKERTPLAVTLSLGERDEKELALWRECGADRYLLRFETSNPALYDRIHPPGAGGKTDRIALLRKLKAMGYEIGSGVMIGLPGQSWADLAADLRLFADLDLDMIGVGPYILHPATPLGRAPMSDMDPAEQVPASEELTYRVVALARLLVPRANIPSTSALATLNLAKGRELGLQRGANILMPNMTPRKYRALYEIYPAKACIEETAEECRSCMRGRIHAIGRTVGVGRGDAPPGNEKGRG